MKINEVKQEVFYGGDAWISFNGSKRDVEQLFEKTQHFISQDKDISVDVKIERKKRTLNANAYMWVLLGNMAEELDADKEELYRNYIRRYGQYVILKMTNKAIDRHIEDWEGRGIGWFSDLLGPTQQEGFSNIISYYGSSTYKSDEMAKVISQIVDDSKELGLETLTPNELQLMMKEEENE